MIRRVFVLASLALALAFAGAATAQEIRIKNGSGGDMRVIVDGAGASKAVILAHQYPGDAQEWRFFVRTLTGAGFTVYRFDFNGYGKYSGSKARTANHKDVANVYALARQQGAQQIWLIGSSMGSGAVLKAGESLDTMGIVAMAPYVDNRNIATPTSSSARRIREPVLLMTSMGDDTLGNAQKLDRILPNSRLLTYKGSAHGMALLKGSTKRDATAQILAFLGAR